MPSAHRRTRNSLKHGLTSLLPVLPGVESEDEWERHLAGVAQSLLPQTHLEGMLAERIALLLWRLRRVARYERQVTLAAHQDLEVQYTTPSAIIKEAERAAEWTCGNGTDDDAPVSTPALVALVDAIPAVPGYGLIRRGPALQVLRALADAAGGMDLHDVLTDLLGYEDATTVEGWVHDMLKEAVDRVARNAGVSCFVLKERALRTLTPRLSEAQAEGRQAFERACAANILPDQDVVERVIRYEAHLNRQLLTSLHELEALQARRMGRAAPLARLDVAGLPEGA